ncbi:MAG TPA: alpha/beta fold hydrolase [Usitatibacter sp.]|nr:alpha/beta fold hydrolase [Usitatibacter sp.]
MQFIVQGYPAYAYTGGVEFDARLPALVFVHGAAFDHSVWQWQSRYFAHHGHCVLAVDLPGHGKSPGLLRERIEDWSAWLVAFLDAAGLERAALVGHSMGSLVTLETALAAPGRVRSLALVGSAVPMGVGDAFLAAAREEPAVAFDMEATWGHARLSQLASSAVPGASLMGASRSLNARSRPGALAAALQACKAYRPDAEALRALKVPTLVVAGRRDQMTPFKAGRALASEIPGARFEALDAGHSMMSEAPRELLRALRDFLAG